MQEVSRYDLLSVLQKAMKYSQKKIFLHRIIYIANYTQTAASDATQNSRVFNILIDSNIKLINEDYCEDVITGFGLFYSGYFINIIEGPEETLIKHLKSLVNTFDQNFQKSPEVTRMKILLVSHHINKRYYASWNGRSASPPLLLEKIEQTDNEASVRQIQNCIMKLYRMSEYLRNQNPNYLRAAMDNISELCRHYLPEVNLLDFLLSCPALIDLREYIETYGSVPDFSLYRETIWPLPSDFVPKNILGDEVVKALMSTEASTKVQEEEEETTEG
ncbi:hypothetical protein RUM43_013427 [Polyplax serrata]|uniref:BLUF domain-containing protein n=1 Tax=Polyplax serrata TaxID=468196 RepID=A0AAN8PRU5_POLSC